MASNKIPEHEVNALVFSTIVTCFRSVLCNELGARKMYIPKKSDEDWCQLFKLCALEDFATAINTAKESKWFPAAKTVNSKTKTEQSFSVAWRLAQGFKYMFKEVK